MHEEEFKALGNGKILFNTSIGPAFEAEDLKNWLEDVYKRQPQGIPV